jgi:hypothetical protein
MTSQPHHVSLAATSTGIRVRAGGPYREETSKGHHGMYQLSHETFQSNLPILTIIHHEHLC